MYTHYGSPGVKLGTKLADQAIASDWAIYNRQGELVTNRTDYSHDKPGAVRVGRQHAGYRDYLNQRWSELLDHLKPDYIYMDTSPAPGEYDWRTLTAVTVSDVAGLYAGLARRAFQTGQGAHMNFPAPVGNCFGYAEAPWHNWMRSEWRAFAGRMTYIAAFNVPGRWISAVGHIVNDGHPGGEEGSLYLRMMMLYGQGLSLLDFKGMNHKEAMLVKGAPYLQAVYELHGRKLVPAVIEPNFWAAEGDLEAHAWRCDGYGLITAHAHSPDARPGNVKIATRPLGLEPDRPVYVWRLTMPDPRSVDYDDIELGKPWPRLARQRLLAIEAPGEQYSAALELDEQFPEALMLTHCPAVISEVDGRKCQFWMPAAYGCRLSGSATDEQVDLTVDNADNNAVVMLVAVPGDWPWQLHVVRRDADEDGTEFKPHPYKVLRHGAFKLVKLKAPSSKSEIRILRHAPGQLSPAEQALLKQVTIARLPSVWKFRPDTKNVGVTGKWFARTAVDDDWQDIKADSEVGWTGQDFAYLAGPETGYGWYRLNVAKPADSKHVYMFFGAVDEQAWVYLNGQSVGEHTAQSTGRPAGALWKQPFAIDLSDQWKRGAENLLVVRVHNQGLMGGIWKPMFLVRSDKALEAQTVQRFCRRAMAGQ